MSYYTRMQKCSDGKKQRVKKSNPYRDALGRFASEDMAVQAGPGSTHFRAAQAHVAASATLRGIDNELADAHLNAARAHNRAEFAHSMGWKEGRQRSQVARDLSRQAIAATKRKRDSRDAENIRADVTALMHPLEWAT